MPVKFPSIKLKLDLQHLLPILYRFFFGHMATKKNPIENREQVCRSNFN